MATLPEFRQQGIGKAVVSHAEEKLKEHHVHYLWCKGRTSVQEYYEKIGFSSIGTPFAYPGLGPHIIMAKKL